MQADMMKLIAYGKVMDDDNKSLKDYSIKEGDFLVVMISKVYIAPFAIDITTLYFKYQAKPAAKPKTEDQKQEEATAQ